MPIVEVGKNSGVFGRLPAGVFTQRAGANQVQRAPGSGYRRVNHQLEDDTFACTDQGLEEAYDDNDAANFATVYNYEQAVMNRLRRMVALEREIRVAGLLHNTSTFPLSGSTGHTASTAWTNTGCDPRLDVALAIQGVKARCGLEPDTLQISYRAWRDLSRCVLVLDALKYVERTSGALPLQALADVLGVRRVLVGDMPYNSADQGQTVSITNTWSSAYAFVCVTGQTSDISETCIGRTFANVADGGIESAEMYRDETVRSWIYRNRSVTQEKVINSACGYLIATGS
jgi:hypothetical protein